MQTIIRSRFVKWVTGSQIRAILAIFLLAGCATQPATKKDAAQKAEPKRDPIFFPPPPDEPRLQFLAAFNSEQELRGKSGGFAKFLTGQELPKNPIAKPYGVAIHHGKVYVVDTALKAILILDLEARSMRGFVPRGEGAMQGPINVYFDDQGLMYVSDGVRNQVLIYDKDEKYIAAIGTKGEMKPRDMVARGDKLYVADTLGHGIRIYNKTTRALESTLPKEKDAANIMAKLFQPSNLTMDKRGHLYASDTGAFRVQEYDQDGNYVRTYGRNGDGPGEFKLPKGIAVDHESRLYAVDAANQIVQMFDDQGRLLMWFGEPQVSAAGLNLPAKVIVDYENVPLFQKSAAPGYKVAYLVIVTNQYGPRKVSVYGFLQKK